MSDDVPDIAQLRATVDALREQVANLESRLTKLEGPPPAEPAPSAPAARTIPPPGPPPVRRQYVPRAERPPRPPREPSALEQSIKAFISQGNPLNKLGALSLMIGAALVFKYAVDNNLIGETGRVVLGLLAGLAFFGAGEYYAHKAWTRFASGLVAAGNGIAFIAIYFGQQQYEIIPAGVAFSLYVLMTAAAVAQSLRYNNVALAVWGLLGGYITPVLASTGTGNYVFLSSYLLVLNTGVFAIGYYRNWQPLKWMAFLLTEPYIILWVADYMDTPGDTRWLELHWILPFLAAFFLYFAAIPTWRSMLKREPIDIFGQALTVVNGVAQFVLAVVLLQEEHRIWLGVIAVGVTAIYVVISSQVVRQPVLDPRALRIFTGTAAGFLLLATPYLVHGHTITLVWCAETVFIAWVCTRERFGFLQLHIFAMLGIICIRLVGYDNLFSMYVPDPDARYIPFTTLRSYPPFAAAIAFAAVAYFLRRIPKVRIPAGLALGLGLIALTAAINAEAYRLARYTLAPHETRHLWTLISAGLLIFTMTALWFGAGRRVMAGRAAWMATLGLALVLSLWTIEALFWADSYRHMLRIIGNETGLLWLHTGTLLMAPLLLLFPLLVRETPDSVFGLQREYVRAFCMAWAIIIAMLLLRREIFAITHAPPFGDLFSETAKQAGYKMLLSVSYALLAFGVYLNGIRADSRVRVYGAYALYTFVTFKVYFLDMQTQHPLYGAFAVIALGTVLIVSSYFANRHRSRHVEATT